jgi:hypothetical protein
VRLARYLSAHEQRCSASRPLRTEAASRHTPAGLTTCTEPLVAGPLNRWATECATADNLTIRAEVLNARLFRLDRPELHGL